MSVYNKTPFKELADTGEAQRAVWMMTTAGTAVYENYFIHCFFFLSALELVLFEHSNFSSSMKLVVVTSTNGVFTLQIWHPGANGRSSSNRLQSKDD